MISLFLQSYHWNTKSKTTELSGGHVLLDFALFALDAACGQQPQENQACQGQADGNLDVLSTYIHLLVFMDICHLPEGVKLFTFIEHIGK